MIRYFCDCCGHEMQKDEMTTIISEKKTDWNSHCKIEVCEACMNYFKKIYDAKSRGFTDD